MQAWWNGLTTLNQVFYVAAGFFSIFLVWQIIALLLGFGGHGDADVPDAHADVPGDADLDVAADHGGDGLADEFDAASTAAFHLISFRSVLAFCTLFTWGGALYLNFHLPLGAAMVYSALWGVAAMTIVALLVNFMRRMAVSGTASLRSSLGRTGVVYLDIPADGQGEVRVRVGEAMAHVRARSRAGALSAGVAVRVVRTLDDTTVEVEPTNDRAPEEEAGE